MATRATHASHPRARRSTRLPAELVEGRDGLEGLDGQPLREVCGRDCFAEEKALSAFAPQLPNHCQLSLGLDSFRGRFHVQARGNPHRGIDQYPRVRAGDRLADDLTVDLDEVHRQAMQVRQR